MKKPRKGDLKGGAVQVIVKRQNSVHPADFDAAARTDTSANMEWDALIYLITMLGSALTGIGDAIFAEQAGRRSKMKSCQPKDAPAKTKDAGRR